MSARSFIAALLLFATGTADAAWVKIAETDTDTFYYESTMVRRVGKIMRLWQMVDHGRELRAERGPYRSSKVQVEMRCADNLWRITFLTHHPKPMGEGNPLDAVFEPAAPWEKLIENTPTQKIAQTLCPQR